jgi:hypothetical protein
MSYPQAPAKSILRSLAVLALAAGCGSSDSSDSSLKTHPVRGKVVFKGGDVSRLDGGKVWFQSTSDAGLKAVGYLTDEGTFAMSTLLPDKAVFGVPAGQYKARVEPPPDVEGKAQPRLIHARHQDFNKSGLSFTVPVNEAIVIEVERPGR